MITSEAEDLIQDSDLHINLLAWKLGKNLTLECLLSTLENSNMIEVSSQTQKSKYFHSDCLD